MQWVNGSQIGRRRFLMIMGGALGALAVGGCARRVESLGHDARGQDRVITVTRTALGAAMSIRVIHPDEAVARQAADAAFDEIGAVESVLSLYRPSSDVSRLNAMGELDRPDAMLVEVLGKAAEVSWKTDGAFDVTVQPLWQLYAKAQQQGRLPDAAEVSAARARVDWRRVEASERRVRIGAGMAITLNGIAQGYAADRARAVLVRHGIAQALIDTGEFSTLGGSAGQDAWTIGVQHPRRREAYIAMAGVTGKCLATTGDYETTFSDDARHNHVFDPKTGRSPLEFASVTVLAETAMDADAISTAVFVLGRERGLRFVREMKAEALCVMKDGTVLATNGFPQT